MTVTNIAQHDLLQAPEPVTDSYMLVPIEEGFSWQTCFECAGEGEWYLVAFRSKHRADADEAFLTWLDDNATRAAQATPGFLHYFTGVPIQSGECLSFCLWENRAAAVAGSSHRAHGVAKEQGLSNYEYYRLERYYIRKTAGELTFTPLEPISVDGRAEKGGTRTHH